MAILDANVRRVLTRALGFGADLAVAANEHAWDRATDFITQLEQSMPRYTPEPGGLGAMVYPTRKRYTLCPLQSSMCGAARRRA